MNMGGAVGFMAQVGEERADVLMSFKHIGGCAFGNNDSADLQKIRTSKPFNCFAGGIQGVGRINEYKVK